MSRTFISFLGLVAISTALLFVLVTPMVNPPANHAADHPPIRSISSSTFIIATPPTKPTWCSVPVNGAMMTKKAQEDLFKAFDKQCR